MRKNILMSAPIVAALFLSACGGPSGGYSASIPAKDLSVEMHVSNNGDEVINVEVMLRSGSVATGNSVFIGGGERLLVSTIGGNYREKIGASGFESLEQALNKVKVLDRGDGINSPFFGESFTWYYSQFLADTQNEPVEYTLILERPSRKDSTKSVVALPAQFLINTPQPGDTYSRLGDIMVTWDNTVVNASMSVIGSLICVSGDSQVWDSGELYPDTGSYVIPADSFPNIAGVCSLTLRVTRTNLGVLDPVFTLGGIVLGHQIRSVVVNTVP